MTHRTTPHHFVRHVAPQLLQQVTANASPLWGKMNVQHMIEHLQKTLWMSTGCGKKPLMVSIESLPKRKNDLLSNQAFPKNVRIPNASKYPMPLRYDNIEKAKNQLLLSINYFYFYYKTKPNAVQMHPLFGELSFEEWEWFHYKHFVHHFSQFGLVNKKYKIGNFVRSFGLDKDQRMVA